MMRKFGSLVLLAGALAVPDSTPSQIRGWLESVDATRNAFSETIISARATQITQDKVAGSAEFDIYRKGQDRALIVFVRGKNSGRKILTSGDRMWLIVPGSRNPVPITPNQRLLGGASFGDVARLRFAEDFTATLRPGREIVRGQECRVLDLTAKAAKSPYPRIVLWMDLAEELQRKALFLLPSGRAAKEVFFTKFARAGGKTVVSEMEIHDLLVAEARAVTRLEYREYRPARLDDAIFTPEGARGL